MKTLLKFMAFVIAMTLLQHCTTEEEPLKPEKVQFTFAVSEEGNSGGRTQTNIPDGTQLLISLQNGAGTPVLTNHKVNILKLGGGIITEPFELAPTHYIVTDFMLIHDGNVLYAAPRKGSPLAQAVISPLPFGFNVMKNTVTNVQVEVLDVKQYMPKDLGYASFNIGFKNTFELAVLAVDNGKTALASAKVTLMQNNQIIKTWNVDAKINLLSFGGEATQPYTLIVEKEHYPTYTETADLSWFRQNNVPFKVLLEPILTMEVRVSHEYHEEFEVEFIGDEYANILINWGDGTPPMPSGLTDEPSAPMRHRYASEGNYVITVTGDLHEIKGIISLLDKGVIQKADLYHMTELTKIAIDWTSGPKVLDLRRNSKLETVWTENLPELESLLLPENHRITSLSVSGPNQLDADDINTLTANIYRNATTHNIRSGSFTLSTDFSRWENAEMIGPPSAESIAKLKELKFNYNWYIAPNIW